MSLTGNDFGAADLAAITGNNNDSFGGDGAWWLIVLFLFAFAGGWGRNGSFGGNGANGDGTTYIMNDVQRGFDQSAIINGLNGINNAVTGGFASAEVANCSRAADAMQTAYTNQIASMNQNFANAQALNNRLAAMEMAQQNCCCENRAAVADLKYTVATEACADRAAVESALRDLLTAQTAQIQSLKDQMCQDKIDAKNERIAELQTQLNMANLAASQTAQTSRILADNAAQTVALEQYLNPTPIPAYVVQNPSCCNQNYGCGCGCGM